MAEQFQVGLGGGRASDEAIMLSIIPLWGVKKAFREGDLEGGKFDIKREGEGNDFVLLAGELEKKGLERTFPERRELERKGISRRKFYRKRRETQRA